MNRRLPNVGILILALALVVGACGGDDESTSTTEAATTTAAAAATTTTAPPEPISIKVATSGGVNTAIQPVLYADTSGLFAQFGLDVELVQLTDDTTAVQGLLAGEYDILYTGAGTGMVAIANGAEVKLVMSFAPWVDYQFVARPGINTLKDMEGKVLGVSRIGALSYQAPLLALEIEGVDTSSLDIQSIGNDAARGQALIAGTIDGAVLNGVNATQTLAADATLTVIYNVGALFRDQFMSTAVYASSSLINENPEAVQAVVNALIQASRDLMSDKQVAIAQALSTGLPADAVEGTYDLLYASEVPYYGVDGGVTQASVESTIALLSSGDDPSIKGPLAYDEVVDTQFIEQAIVELGPYGG